MRPVLEELLDVAVFVALGFAVVVVMVVFSLAANPVNPDHYAGSPAGCVPGTDLPSPAASPMPPRQERPLLAGRSGR